MDPELVEAIKVVMNAMSESRSHLQAGFPKKALAELSDPLLQKAISEIEVHIDASASTNAG